MLENMVIHSHKTPIICASNFIVRTQPLERNHTLTLSYEYMHASMLQFTLSVAQFDVIIHVFICTFQMVSARVCVCGNNMSLALTNQSPKIHTK